MTLLTLIIICAIAGALSLAIVIMVATDDPYFSGNIIDIFIDDPNTIIMAWITIFAIILLVFFVLYYTIKTFIYLSVFLLNLLI